MTTQDDLAAVREALEQIVGTDFYEPSDWSELGRIAAKAIPYLDLLTARLEELEAVARAAHDRAQDQEDVVREAIALLDDAMANYWSGSHLVRDDLQLAWAIVKEDQARVSELEAALRLRPWATAGTGIVLPPTDKEDTT